MVLLRRAAEGGPEDVRRRALENLAIIVPGSPADDNFAPNFSVDYMAKDLSYAIKSAQAAGASLLLATLVEQLYLATSALGEGSKDFSAVIHTVEQLSARH